MTRKRIGSGEKCIVVYKKGKRAGTRCGRYTYAPTSVYCSKHGKNKDHSGGNPNLQDPKQLPAIMANVEQGKRNFWARMRAAVAADPELARLQPGPTAKGYKQTREQVAKRTAASKRTKLAKKSAERVAAGLPPLEIPEAPPPEPPKEKPSAEMRPILRAQRELVAARESLPALPDKPFEEMEPHEKLVALTGMGLDHLYNLLKDPLADPEVAPVKAKLQMQAATAALTMRVKVDSNALRARKVDRMGDILARLKGTQAPGDEAKLVEG